MRRPRAEVVGVVLVLALLVAARWYHARPELAVSDRQLRSCVSRDAENGTCYGTELRPDTALFLDTVGVAQNENRRAHLGSAIEGNSVCVDRIRLLYVPFLEAAKEAG